MKEKINKFFPVKLFTKNVIFIDGISRAGKLMAASLVSSFQKMESFEKGYIFEHFNVGVKLKKCSANFASAFLSTYLNELLYNKMISRNVNFRPSDRTSIHNFHNPSIYKSRLKMNEGDAVINRLSKQEFFLPIVTHEMMADFDAFLSLNLEFKLIEIYRNPIDLTFSWVKQGLGKRLENDPRMFSLLLENSNKKPMSRFLYEVPSNWKKFNEFERCTYMANSLLKKSIKNHKKVKNKLNIFTIFFEDLINNPHQTLKNTANFLNTKFSANTKKIIKKEKLPNLKFTSNVDEKRKFLKKKINSELYNNLVKLELEYVTNRYNIG